MEPQAKIVLNGEVLDDIFRIKNIIESNIFIIGPESDTFPRAALLVSPDTKTVPGEIIFISGEIADIKVTIKPIRDSLNSAHNP